MNFDYIIVGAGTSGCVIANELSKKGYSVGLIEKGRQNFVKNFFNKFPNGTFLTLRNKYFTKNYQCEASKYLNYRKLDWPRGEIPGGCSAINGLVYKRGAENDFEYLIKNNKRINWELIKKFYLEIEQELNINTISNNHSQKNTKNIITENFLQTLKNLKFYIYKSFVENDFTKSFIAGNYDLTIKNKQRTYAKNFLKNSSVKLIEGCDVKKIIFEQSKAIGVIFQIGKKEKKFFANKEIIISAGAINTPKILQLSGIGDQKHLEHLGIKCIFNNHLVGENLRDHLQTKIIYETKSKKNFNYLLKNKLVLIVELLKYFLKKDSLLNEGVIKAGAFCNLNDDKKYEYQLNLLLASGIDVSSIDKFNGLTLSVNTLNPRSKGFVKIKSNNFLKDPMIFPNYFSDKNNKDIQKHIDGIKKIREIANTKPFKDILIKEKLPGAFCKTNLQISEFIKNCSTTIYHHTGTCKFGSKDNGVVDKNFSVYGVSNLRICDASIMPRSINGNTAATCYVLGKVLANIL
jgi:choline dehydrogenase